MEGDYVKVQKPYRAKVYVPFVKEVGQRRRYLKRFFRRASEAKAYADEVAERYVSFCILCKTLELAQEVQT